MRETMRRRWIARDRQGRTGRGHLLRVVLTAPLVLATSLPLAADAAVVEAPRPAQPAAAPRVHDPARAAQAWTARLSAQVAAHADATAAEAFALARAAQDAAQAAREVSAATADPELGVALAQAEETLARLRALHAPPPTLVPVSPDPAVAVPDLDPTTDVPVADPSEQVAAATDLMDAADEAFGLAMQVEVAAEEARSAQTTSRLAGLEELEALAAAASGLVEVARTASDGAPAPRSAAIWPISRVAGDAWPNGAIPTSELCALPFADGHLLRCDAADALELLAAAYEADTGRALEVVSSYRTYEQQVALKATKGWLAATPGTSQHGRGLAVDLGSMGGLGEFDAPAYLWMKENAPAFGWYHPPGMEPGGSGPPEPWHWEYRG